MTITNNNINVENGGIIMSSFFGNSSNSIGTLFSSLSSSSSSSNLLADYYSIRNGSYKKLLNAYYGKFGTDTKSTSTTSKSTTTSTSISSDSSEKLSKIKSNSDKLLKSTSALLDRTSSSLFKETVSKDENGKEVKSYDMDGIYQGVKDFIDNYNNTLDSAKDSNVTTINRGYAGMISATKANEKMLNEIGITIGTDNKLSIDETKFKSADVIKMKSLFNTSNAYGHTIARNVSSINASATVEAAKTNTYTYKGSYSSYTSVGDLYDSLF